MAAHELLLTLAIVAVALLASPAAEAYPWVICGPSTYTAKSHYLANINRIGATLSKNASQSPDLFATAKVGAAPDQVWALALCRGDANASYCFACLDQAFQDLPNACPFSKEATVFYDSCVLHYSNIHSHPTDGSTYSQSRPVRNIFNATVEPARFQRLVAALVNATVSYAVYNSTRLYASGEAGFDREFPKVYAWAQCTPDLTPARCRDCLVQNMDYLADLFTDSIGARVVGMRCSYRYDTVPFFDGPVMVRLAGTSASSRAPASAPASSGEPASAPAGVPNVLTPVTAAGKGRNYSVPAWVLIVVLPTIAAINLFACLLLWRRRRALAQAKQPYPNYSTEAADIDSVDSMLIDISTLRAATGDFAEINKLGEGAFGSVYKGTLPNGEEIAVKRLSKSSAQGVEELKNELALLAKLKHKNLVTLVGVCLEQQERLLVYEFVPGRSLDKIIFDTERREQLDWVHRYKIINGIARGMQYLHEDSQLKVVHRDLKASNILLDNDMNPKISDFGLARLFGRDQTQAVTNRVVGTYGYMAPEYATRGNYSMKSDAFSFGVMVLEILTGRKNNDIYNSQQSENLLTMMWGHWTAGTVLGMMDLSMRTSFSESEVLKCIHIGLLCVQGNPADRPVMSSVVMMLGSEIVSLRAPSKPTFYGRSNVGANSGIASTSNILDGPRDSI
ncbi:cysteine-rich receptor-like protein kinase 6 [Lolium rigidum]|uniref:cysteine-rich receptor-like protein kinase 6 n=1 Tax=Lolium rigidum TaxID=89674 RepID=UPI001F5CA8B9|nr:cysteine-rich receptor-like protein kinase 6 [Lolium rigidum]